MIFLCWYKHCMCLFQEWQNSIQKNAGLAFIELINEGRLGLLHLSVEFFCFFFLCVFFQTCFSKKVYIITHFGYESLLGVDMVVL